MPTEVIVESRDRPPPPVIEAHRSFLVYRRFLHLKIAAALSGVAVLAYLLHSPRGGTNGGTWLGYTLGTIAALIIVWLTWFGWRKRSYGAARMPLTAWLSGHVYLGLSLIVLATLHTGFEFGYNVHTLAYALMMLVIASGAFGIFAYARYPGMITRNRMGSTQIQLLGQIAVLDGELRQAIMTMEDEVVRLVAPATEQVGIGGSMWQQLSARYRGCATAAALASVEAFARTLPSDRQAAARGVLILLSRKEEVLERVRRDIQYKALMEIWLYVHVPMTFALLTALVVHIFSVFFYW